MQTSVIVLVIAVFAATLLYGVARLLVWGLPRVLRWRSPLRLSAVVAVWLAVSALLIWPLYLVLLLPSVVSAAEDGFFLTLIVGCHAASLIPFGVYFGRHRDRIVRAGKEALIA